MFLFQKRNINNSRPNIFFHFPQAHQFQCACKLYTRPSSILYHIFFLKAKFTQFFLINDIPDLLLNFMMIIITVIIYLT